MRHRVRKVSSPGVNLSFLKSNKNCLTLIEGSLYHQSWLTPWCCFCFFFGGRGVVGERKNSGDPGLAAATASAGWWRWNVATKAPLLLLLLLRPLCWRRSCAFLLLASSNAGLVVAFCLFFSADKGDGNLLLFALLLLRLRTSQTAVIHWRRAKQTHTYIEEREKNTETLNISAIQSFTYIFISFFYFFVAI